MNVIVAAVLAVCVIGVLFFVYLRSRGKGDAQKDTADPLNPTRFDTTLGEFHDMRQALRPLQHTRMTSRRDPGKRG